MKITKEKLKNLVIDLLLKEEAPPEGADGLYEYRDTDSPRTREDIWHDFFSRQKYPSLIGAFYILLIIHIVFSLVLYLLSLARLDIGYLPRNPFYIMFWILVPVGMWVWSTAFTFWNYHDRKLLSLRLVVLAVSMTLLQQLCRFFMIPILRVTMMIPISSEVTIPMVVHLSQGIIFLVSMIPSVVLFISIIRLIGDKTSTEEITHFKVTRDMDLRDDKEFQYDLSVVKDIETGREHVVQENDRFLHGFADGTTGTAKTSSVLTVAVCNDLDQRAHNIDFQKRECAEALQDGIFEVVKPFADEDFSIEYIAPKYTDDEKAMRERKKKYDYLKYTSKSCGITVVAPNASWADDVYQLASARGMKVNRIDPIPAADGRPKKGFMGFNPLYVSPGLSGKEREVDITNKAGIFADVLSGLFQRGGGGDYYFTTLNNSWTIATCMLLMITYDPRLDENQPNPSDVQEILNDVEKARPYLKRMADRFGNNGSPYRTDDAAWKVISDQILGTRYDWAGCGINCGNYQYIWDLFFNDILGASKARMHDQANGLRMQINKFLTHPYIRNVLCVPDSLSVDIDLILSQGQITTVNYAWELGKSISMAFGQFWLLSFGKAVVRRPTHLKKMIPHFNYIDELAILLHPDIEEFVSLHRQYKNANFFAFQTLDQMDKSSDTRYLKGVLLGNCATQILFGRISPTEMKIYEQMAGMVMSDIEQKTVSETSLTTENPSYSYSTRTSSQMAKRIEGTDMRYRDFQEVTMLSVRQGTPEEPIAGRVDFLPDSRRKGTPRIHVYWDQFFSSLPSDSLPLPGSYRPWYQRYADRQESDSSFIITSSAAPLGSDRHTESSAAPGRDEPSPGKAAAPGRSRSGFRLTSRGVDSDSSFTVITGKPLPPEDNIPSPEVPLPPGKAERAGIPQEETSSPGNEDDFLPGGFLEEYQGRAGTGEEDAGKEGSTDLPPEVPLPSEEQERAGIPPEEQLYDGEQMLGDLFDGKAAAVPDPEPHEAHEDIQETLEDLFDDLVPSPAAEVAQASPDASPDAEGEFPGSGMEREGDGEKKDAAAGKKRVPDFKKRREWPQKKDESLSEPPVDIGIEFVGFRR